MTSTPTESKHLLAAKALLELFRANYQAKKDRLEGAESLLEQYFPKKTQPDTTVQRNSVRLALSEAFKRSPQDEWSYQEQCLLIEACRRPDVEKECAEIIAFKPTVRLFPNSIERLLSAWTATLDRARNERSSNLEPPSRRSMEDERKRISKRLEEIRPHIKAESTFSDASKAKFRAEIEKLKQRDDELKQILGQAI